MSADPAAHRLSRRGLFGAGLTRAVRAGLDAAEARGAAGALDRPRPAAPVAVAPTPVAPTVNPWTTGPLGARLRPALDRLHELLDPRPGECVRDLDRAPLGSADAPADVVLAPFTLLPRGDLRAAGADLRAAVVPGGRLGLLAFDPAGAIGAALRAGRREAPDAWPAGARPERWGSYEGLMLALERFDRYDVHDGAMTWRFPDADALWAAVAPGLCGTGRGVLEGHVVADADGLTLRVEYCCAIAHREG